MAEAELAPLETIVHLCSFIDSGDSFQAARDLPQYFGDLQVVKTFLDKS